MDYPFAKRQTSAGEEWELEGVEMIEPVRMTFTKETLQMRAREYCVWLYGKPGVVNDADKWHERFGLLYGFIDECFSETNESLRPK